MIIIFMGPPGAGKGTQATKLSQRRSIPHISTGDILRDAISKETSLGYRARFFLDAGELVPDDVVIGIINERISEPDTREGFILDGFPRTIKQANELDKMLTSKHLKIDCVLSMAVPDDEIMKRLLGRAEIEKRSDDTPDAIARRLENYNTQTQPLIDYYSKEGVFREINGVGDPGTIEERILTAISS